MDTTTAAAEPLNTAEPAEKELARITAEFARRGWTLHALASGELLACRWGASRALPDARAAAALLAQIGR